MENKEYLFAYGTLSSPTIQMEVLGRTTELFPDSLNGYRKSEIIIEDKHYPLIVPDSTHQVEGFLFEVTKDELKLIDAYETDAYKRQKVNLKSGKSAWVYVKA